MKRSRAASHIDLTEVTVQLLDEQVAGEAVGTSQAREMSRIAAAIHEARQRRLLEPCCSVVHQCLSGAEKTGQMLRNDNETEAYACTKNARETANEKRR